MKYAALALSLTLLLADCRSAPPAAKGMASLLVHVQAEPKTGAQPSPQKVPVYDTPGAQTDRGAFAKVDYSDLDEIVVWVEPAAAAAISPAPTPGPITIDIDPAKSSTALADVVSVGQRIILRNASASPQTIYSVSDGNEFDLESVPASGQAEYTVRSPGLIEVLTNTTKENPVQVYAAPSPWVRMARAGETVVFSNLSPGQYRLISWHPRLPGSQTAVTLSPDQATDASIDVSVNSLPKVSAGSGG